MRPISTPAGKDDDMSEETTSTQAAAAVVKTVCLRLRSGNRISKRRARLPTFRIVGLDPHNWSGPHRHRFCGSRLTVDDFLGRFSINKATPISTLCRKCGVSFCLKNFSFCNGCLNIQEGNIDGIPTCLGIRYCQGCNSYSFTGRADFVCAPLQSAEMLRFLLRRLDFCFYRLQLDLVDVTFMPQESSSNNIRIALLLEQEAVDGTKLMKRHVVDYVVARQNCHGCSLEELSSQWTFVVQVRQCSSDRQSIPSLMYRIGRSELMLIKRCKRVGEGVDIYFASDGDAMAYFNLLRSRLPIRPDTLTKSVSDVSYITAMVCPILPGDLIYLRSNKVLAALHSSCPLVICTLVTNSVFLLDPFKLTETTVGGDEYWTESTAFQIYKDGRGLVEYVVLSVRIVSRESKYWLADVEVAGVADFGKTDMVFTTRTHLGKVLNLGDHVYGYDLYAMKNGDLMADEGKESLPDVVLIRKSYNRATSVRRKITSPEYEDFLNDLEKNPEAMFSLSLNSEKNAENQQPGIDSAKPGENSDFDLEGLLADLVLRDQQAVDTPGPGCSI